MTSRALRYLFVGIYNTGVGYMIFYSINCAFDSTLHYLIVLVISYLLSLTHAYFGQRLLVFRSTDRWGMEYLRFLLVNLSGMLTNALLLFFFIELGIGLMMAQAVSVVIVTLLSYIGHRKFSFKST
jgi:putative flippase GtrA